MKELKTCQMESVRLKINEHMTSVGEEIVCVLEQQQSVDVCRVKLDVRVFVLERLSAAAVSMFNLFQREIETLHNIRLHTAEHHRERSTESRGMASKTSTLSEEQQQMDQGRGLFDANTQPVVKLYMLDQCVESSLKVKRFWSVKQEPENHLDINFLPLTVCKDEVFPEHEEKSPSLVQEEHQPPDVKEEQEKLLHRPEVAMVLLEVKSEDYDEKREIEPVASTSTEHMRTQASVEDCGTSQPTRDEQLLSPHCSEFIYTVTEDSDNRKETREDFLPLTVCKEEVFPEHEEKSLSLVQEEHQPPDVKEEQEELLQGPEVAMVLLAVKSEDYDENRETEPVASTSTEHTRTQASVEDCGTSQLTRDDQLLSPQCSDSDVTEESDAREETREGQSAVNTLDSHKTQNVEEQTLSSSHKLSQDQTSTTQTHSTKSHTGKKGFSCTECGKMFSRKGHLKRHKVVHTGEKPFACKVFGKCSSQSGDLKKHMRTHTVEKPFACKVCGKCCSKSSNLKTHMRTHTGEKPFSCKVCGKGWGRSDGLKEHMMTHTGEKPFSCKVCGKGFSQSGHLKTHMMAHTGERPFAFTVCGKCFSRSSDVKIHMGTHTGERPFSCKVCGKGCGRSDGLKQHMMIHTGEKPFSCKLCGKGFRSSGDLKTHMMTHTGEKPFACTVCGKGCLTMSNLKTHMRSHTGEKPFACTVCGKCFSQSGDLKTHMRTHTGEKPFSCKLCGKGCGRSDGLKQHMMIHTGEKPFSCKLCGRGFSQSGTMKRHMKTHEGEKPFACTVCGKGCHTMANLKTHMRSHTGEKPFSCKVCGKGFSNRGALKIHTITHTGKEPFS